MSRGGMAAACRLVRFVSVEPQNSGVSARDHELAGEVWLAWCNGRNLTETVAAALAQAREQGARGDARP